MRLASHLCLHPPAFLPAAPPHVFLSKTRVGGDAGAGESKKGDAGNATLCSCTPFSDFEAEFLLPDLNLAPLVDRVRAYCEAV